MQATATIPQIPKGKEIILPISMSQHLEKGDYLRAILTALENGGYQERDDIGQDMLKKLADLKTKKLLMKRKMKKLIECDDLINSPSFFN